MFSGFKFNNIAKALAKKKAAQKLAAAPKPVAPAPVAQPIQPLQPVQPPPQQPVNDVAINGQQPEGLAPKLGVPQIAPPTGKNLINQPQTMGPVTPQAPAPMAPAAPAPVAQAKAAPNRFSKMRQMLKMVRF